MMMGVNLARTKRGRDLEHIVEPSVAQTTLSAGGKSCADSAQFVGCAINTQVMKARERQLLKWGGGGGGFLGCDGAGVGIQN